MPDTRRGHVGGDLVANGAGPGVLAQAAHGFEYPVRTDADLTGVRGDLAAPVAAQLPHRERRRVAHVVDELSHHHARERPTGRLGLLTAGRLHHGHHQTAPGGSRHGPAWRDTAR